jgi:nucleoside-diphosphate-sugar epimerase
LFSVYGPRERPDKLFTTLIRCILEDVAFPMCEGSEQHQRSYTYIEDAVDGLVVVLDNMDDCISQIFNIGIDTTIPTQEAIRTVEDVIGQRAQVATAPRRPGDQLKTHANIGKARRILGYDPATPLKEGVEKTVAWYRHNILGRLQLLPEVFRRKGC